MDQRTRKLMTMHDVDRLEESRKEEGRELIRIEDNVDRLHRKVERKTDYNNQKQYRQREDQQNDNNTRKRKLEAELYGHLKRQTNEIFHEKTWT